MVSSCLHQIHRASYVVFDESGKKGQVMSLARVADIAYHSFCSMKRGVLLLLLDGMLVHCRLPPLPPSISSGFPDSLYNYTPGSREAQHNNPGHH